MVVAANLVVMDSRYQGSARCAVCGSEIPIGEGITARYADRTLRFKCAGCLARFQADPERYLAGHPPSCCPADEEQSPASEWRCD